MLRRLASVGKYSTFYGMKMPSVVSEDVPEERSVKESIAELVLAFSTDENLRAEYISFTGQIRVGKLLENMDLIAGQASYLHADPSLKNTVMVTACCDRITLKNGFIHPDRDILVKGFPTYVGNSSMEIRVECKFDIIVMVVKIEI